MARTMKRGDTYPPLTGQVLASGLGVDLMNASSLAILFKLSEEQGGPLMATRMATMSEASGQASGLWIYNWVAGDPTTFIVGNWQVESQAIWANGGKQTFPHDDNYEEFIVVQDLDQA